MSRQINKERTRHRLLQAVLKTIQRYGYGTLTTGRVAELAGVAQPTFYVHFRSMDQALEQVAEWVAQELSPGLDPEASAELDRAADVLEEAVRKCCGNARARSSGTAKWPKSSSAIAGTKPPHWAGAGACSREASVSGCARSSFR
ncbi:MAG: TetR/AcrR family transcriptional regulator [Deltaproteobacteria bacterium]|nr:TetR/AcrR family transcriptional regulator [Deltaproteobacteria bacterium]